MLILGMLLVLVGFAMIVPRGGMPGSASARNIRIGPQRFSTPGRQGEQSTRFRVIQTLMGVVVLAGGIVIIAVST